jgi:hypothetical protein
MYVIKKKEIQNMKTLKRTAMWMAKEHSMYKAMTRDDEAKLVYNTKDEKTYITDNGATSFFYNKEGYIRGMYRIENGVETNYELKSN